MVIAYKRIRQIKGPKG